MTSTTNYQKKGNIGEIASLLFGSITVSRDEARKLHTFFEQAAPTYVMGNEYAPIPREQLPVDPSPYYQRGDVYDIFSVAAPGVGMEMTIRVKQGKAEAVGEDRFHYRINVVLKGETVSEQMKRGIEEKVQNLDAMLFSLDTEKRAEFFRDYAQ